VGAVGEVVDPGPGLAERVLGPAGGGRWKEDARASTEVNACSSVTRATASIVSPTFAAASASRSDDPTSLPALGDGGCGERAGTHHGHRHPDQQHGAQPEPPASVAAASHHGTITGRPPVRNRVV
jgi:hypothetical protein